MNDKEVLESFEGLRRFLRSQGVLDELESTLYGFEID